MRLIEALDQSPTLLLRRIAASHGLAHDEATTRAELVDRIAERLADTAYLREQLDSLEREVHAGLLSVRDNGGEIRAFLLERDSPAVADELVERGLLSRTFAAGGARRGEVFVLPEEIMAALPAAPPVQPPPTVGQPAAAERRTTDSAFNLFVLASALSRQAPLEAEVSAWAVEPGGFPTDARWTFLRHTAQLAGLLATRADGQLVPAPTLARVLSGPPGLAERVWRAYVHDRTWFDLAHAGIEDGAEIADPVLLRAALVEAVEGLPVGAWTSLEAFSDWLRHTSPELVREQLDPRGRLQLESVDWRDLERRVLCYCICGPWYWLGRVALSADGRLFSRRAASARVGPPEACTWDGPAHLIAPPRADVGVLLEAERYLVLQERGRDSRYHLVQQHVAAALSSGGSIEDCRALLVRLTQSALPGSVEERLQTWSERFGALAIRPAVLLEARDEHELEAALADPSARPFIRRRLGPSVAEVQAADALELAAALRHSEHGEHLPRVDAALRLAAEPRRAYGGLVDEQVLEFLLVSLLAFERARPERLAELEGAVGLLERLERQFAPERLAELRQAAQRLAGEVVAAPRRQRAAQPRAPGRRRR
jgi:hypothetical protein